MVPIVLVTIVNSIFIPQQTFSFLNVITIYYLIKFNQTVPVLIWVSVAVVLDNIINPFTYHSKVTTGERAHIYFVALKRTI